MLYWLLVVNKIVRFHSKRRVSEETVVYKIGFLVCGDHFSGVVFGLETVEDVYESIVAYFEGSNLRSGIRKEASKVAGAVFILWPAVFRKVVALFASEAGLSHMRPLVLIFVD
jgi:hypothetical protein